MITTRIEDKNKNNFKIIMENFKKGTLNEKPMANATNTDKTVRLSKDGDGYVLTGDGSKFDSELFEIAKIAETIAKKQKESWKKNVKSRIMAALEASLKRRGADANTKLKETEWVQNSNEGTFAMAELYIEKVVTTRAFFLRALKGTYRTDKKMTISRRHIEATVKEAGFDQAEELDGVYKLLDKLDGAYNPMGSFATARNQTIGAAQYGSNDLAEMCLLQALNARFKSHHSSQSAQTSAPASTPSGLDEAAALLEMSVEDLQSALATSQGQSTIMSQLQDNGASQEIINAVQQYIDYIQSNPAAASQEATPAGGGGMSSPDAPASVPAGADTAQASATSPAAATVQTSAGAPSWIKRKAARQEELLRRLNQGLTPVAPVQEEVDPTKLNAKISAGELKLDTDKLSDTTPAAAAAPAKPETQSITLKKIQQALIRLGYNLGPKKADGVYGRATYTAIRNFQKKNKLKTDGLVGPNTFARIREKDKVLKGQSDKIGTNLPKSAEKTLDKVAKAPRKEKLMAYATAAMSKEGKKQLEKVRVSLRKKRKEAIKNKNYEAVSKINAAIRSIGAGESKAREINSAKKQRDFAAKGNALHMLETEWTENTKIFFSWEPELQNLFKKEFSKNKGGIKFGALGRALQVYRTGKNSKNEPAAALQKKMKRLVQIFQDELKKLSKEKQEK